MRKFIAAPLILASLAGVPMFVGCDTVESEKKIDVKDDGTVVKEEKKVTENADGSVTKTEKKDVDKPGTP
ncbi:MAG: hypothetical protein ABIP55_15075 [Tepidisphaeraceae bacterium]